MLDGRDRMVSQNVITASTIERFSKKKKNMEIYRSFWRALTVRAFIRTCILGPGNIRLMANIPLSTPSAKIH